MALLQFRPDPDVPEQRYVELENGCWISVLQRIVPNPEDPDRVRTAAYSYSYSLGPNPDKDWLVRYDYVPERAQDLLTLFLHQLLVAHTPTPCRNAEPNRARHWTR